MSAGHTPGPWSAGDTRYQRDFRTFVNVMSEREDFVACVSSDPMNPATIAANAHLIAAAPDLLEAVIDALAFIDEAISWCTDSELGPLIERRERYEALIAKAEGRS